MDLFKEYFDRSREIIGDRTPEEKRYDAEVLRGLRKGKSIRKAIEKANRRFPQEALKVDDSNIADVQAHYEYLFKHEEIVRKLNIESE